MIRITEAHHLDAYTLLLRFTDGSEGQVDLSDELYGPMLEPLKDPTISSVPGTSRAPHRDLAQRRRLRAGVPTRARLRRGLT